MGRHRLTYDELSLLYVLEHHQRSTTQSPAPSYALVTPPNITNRRWTRATNCLPSIELYTQLDARYGQLYGY